MENLISRYRNLTILAALLFGQVLGLAIQVKRSGENTSTRLIRVWAVDMVTPLEKGIVRLEAGVGSLWRNYFYLRGVRQENRELKEKIQQMEIERVRLNEDAEQAHRLQELLGFKEQFIAKTLAAQVIGSSGSEQSRSIYIDKGSRDGIRPDMAVITADGIVGKVLRVFKSTSQVLLINDQTSGVGAVLEKSRLQGVLRGTPVGEVVLEKVMTDETVQPGEKLLTSGGDQIFPKGLPVGTVTKVSPGADLFLNIRVKPSAQLSKLEEVLVITQQEQREPVLADTQRVRAADILAQRLPSVPPKPATSNPSAASSPIGPKVASTLTTPAPGGSATSNPIGTATATQNPSATVKPHGDNSGMTVKPVNNSAGAVKPVSGPAVVKPASVRKAEPAPVKVAPGTASGAGDSGAAPLKSEAPPAQPAAEPAASPNQPPPQDQPQ
jgi:rod shape-determining protein MreC